MRGKAKARQYVAMPRQRKVVQGKGKAEKSMVKPRLECKGIALYNNAEAKQCKA